MSTNTTHTPRIDQAAAAIRYARGMGLDLILLDDEELGLDGLTATEVEQAYAAAEFPGTKVPANGWLLD